MPPAPTSRTGQVYETLRRKIESREYGPGTQLPAHLRLAGEFGVSPMTVRSVLAELERAGLIERRHGRGTFVRAESDAGVTPPAGDGYRDLVTGLPNRGLFLDRLEQALAYGQRQGHGVGLVIVQVDADRPETCDEVAAAVTEPLRQVVRASDTMARYARDAFAFILPDIASRQSVTLVSEKIVAAARNCRGAAHATAGAALYPFDASDVPGLLAAAAPPR